MKIVQLCPYSLSRHGGVQRHVRDLSAWLSRQNHEVQIIAPPAPGQDPQKDGCLSEIGRSRQISIHGTAFELSHARRRDIQATVAKLREWGADMVHMHTPWTPMLVWQLWRALALPTLTTIHATLPAPHGNGLTDRYIRRAARHFIHNSQAVVIPSNAPRKMLQSLVPEFTPHVLPPAVDLTPWLNAPHTRHRELSVVYLGRLEPRKGIDVLLDAWADCAAQLPQATLTIAGDGALTPLVLRSGLPGMRYFGRPDDTEARALLAGADILVAPAPYGESYGLVLAEAMAAGAVPVAAENDGYKSVLGPQGSDLLTEPGNAKALSAKIIELAQDRTRLERLRDWAKSTALLADVAQVGPAYLRVFQSVLDGA